MYSADRLGRQHSTRLNFLCCRDSDSHGGKRTMSAFTSENIYICFLTLTGQSACLADSKWLNLAIKQILS